MKEKLGSLCFLLTLLATTLSAQVWRGEEAVAVQVNDAKGRPVAGARVVFTFQGIPGETGPDVVASDGKGRAVLADLAPGPWQVEVSHSDYLSYIAMVDVRRGKKPSVSASFLEAGGRSLAPVKVKFSKGNRQQASPVLEARQPAEPAAPATQQPAKPAVPVAEVPAPTAPPPAEAQPQPVQPEPARVPQPVETQEPTAEPAAPPPSPAQAPPAKPEPQPVPTEPVPVPAPEPAVAQEPTVEPAPAPAIAEPAAEPEVTPAVPDTAAEPESPTATEIAAAPPEPVAEPVTVAPPTPAATPAIAEPAGPEAIAAAPPVPAAEPESQDVRPPTPAPQPAPEVQPTIPDDTQAPDLETAPPVAELEPAPQPPTPGEPLKPSPEPQPAEIPRQAEVAPAKPPVAAAPAAAVAALPPPPDTGARITSHKDGSCSDCESAEWTLQVSVAVPARAPGSAGGCGADVLEAAASAMQGLSTSIQLELQGFIGPVANGSSQEALRRVEADLAAPLKGDMAAFIGGQSPCQVVALVLPKAVRFSRLSLAAADQDQTGNCAPGQTCAIGDAAWLGGARVERGPSATIVYGLFENRSTDRGRRAILTAYYRPPNANWQPRLPAAE